MDPGSEEFTKIYADILGEVRFRLHGIDVGTTNKLGVDPILAEEFCYLQLRKICELIAIGALIAHGDIPASNALSDEWHAGEIIKGLAKVNDYCFPHPVRYEPDGAGGQTLIWLANTPLTRAEFPSFYGQCGGHLHRGELNKYLRLGPRPQSVDFSVVGAKAQKLLDLLNNHLIWTPGGVKVAGGLQFGTDQPVYAMGLSKEKPPDSM